MSQIILDKDIKSKGLILEKLKNAKVDESYWKIEAENMKKFNEKARKRRELIRPSPMSEFKRFTI